MKPENYFKNSDLKLVNKRIDDYMSETVKNTEVLFMLRERKAELERMCGSTEKVFTLDDMAKAFEMGMSAGIDRTYAEEAWQTEEEVTKMYPHRYLIFDEWLPEYMETK